MNDLLLRNIATARMLVGAMGEHQLWWTTSFTRQTSRRTLEMIFPRTALRAALTSVTEVAAATHDQQLGPSSAHLFRLPTALEFGLGDWLDRSLSQLSWPPDDVETVLSQIQTLRPVVPPSTLSTGPFCLGRTERLKQPSTLAELVGIYLWRHQTGTPILPYFED